MAAQVVPADDVIVSRTAPAADTHVDTRQSETTFPSCFFGAGWLGWGRGVVYLTSLHTASRVRWRGWSKCTMASHMLLQQTACSELPSPALSPSLLPLVRGKKITEEGIKNFQLHLLDITASWSLYLGFKRWRKKRDTDWIYTLDFFKWYHFSCCLSLVNLMLHKLVNLSYVSIFGCSYRVCLSL